jgi:DinB superfamily
MRRRKTGYILLALLVITGLAGTYHSSLSTKERKTAISYLKETKNLLLTAVSGLNKAQLDFKTAPDKWSIRQCMEHLVITEKSTSEIGLRNLQQPSEPSRRNEIVIKDEEIIQLITQQSLQPLPARILLSAETAGSIRTTGRRVEEFKSLREKNINFLKTTTADLRNHFIEYPTVGTMDNYQLLLMLAAHTRQYTMLIAKIKSNPDFPK